ncbi:MAG TPA: hypothetical protein DDZ81_09450 [Acetobacteraceae bacterium]|jgi:Flp pilus assembly protein TadG|nr:hypothetical protein [Acetobacteraceae bacterium]
MNSSLLKETRASTIPETAIVLSLLLPMLLGGIEIGLMMWTKGTVQSIAALSARCIATNSANCTANATYATAALRTQNYALNLANSLIGPAKVTADDITVTTATSCNSAPGTYDVVTISYSDWVGAILYPDRGRTDTLTACYPI